MALMVLLQVDETLPAIEWESQTTGKGLQFLGKVLEWDFDDFLGGKGRPFLGKMEDFDDFAGGFHWFLVGFG